MAPFMLVFSLVTYRIKEFVFRAWVLFTLVWFVLWITIAVTSSNNRGGGGWIYSAPSEREVVVFLGFWSYIIISIVIVSVMSLRTRKNGGSK